MRYFIHVIADGDRLPDTSGEEFENFTVARSEAIASARELLAMRLRDDQPVALRATAVRCRAAYGPKDSVRDVLPAAVTEPFLESIDRLIRTIDRAMA